MTSDGRARCLALMTDLDIDFVRAQFPAFDEPSLQDLAFFENAGGSYPCRFVTERLARFYRERKVQPYGPFDASRVGGEEMDQARIRLAAMLGVETDELSFGPSTSQNTYVLAQAFRRWLPEGAAIVVTDQDHEANSGAWRRLADDGLRGAGMEDGPGDGSSRPGEARTSVGRCEALCHSRIARMSWARSTTSRPSCDLHTRPGL